MALSGLGIASLICPIAAAVDYRVDVGDVIEIRVARVPELQGRVTVRSDGTISFPLLGTLTAAGLPPAEVEARIQATLATKTFRQRLSDGRENAVAIEPDEITATVVQYRPIYVNGDVSKPGEQTFRPFMTVRQAVALSGGYDVLRIRTENPILLSADLRSDYAAFDAELAKEQAHLSRLRSELGDTAAHDRAPGPDGSMPPSQRPEILSVEAEQTRTEQNDYLREKTYLQRSIRQADEEIRVLSEQETKEQQGTQADAEELQRVLDLFGKGALPSPRVTDSRRAVLLSSTRKLQTEVQLMQLRKQQGDVARQLERLDDQRKIKLLQELQDTGVKIHQLQAKLQSTREKLQYTAARSQLFGGQQLRPEVAIIRRNENGRDRLVVDEDTELRPGDTVEVSLHLDDVAATSKPQAAHFKAEPEPSSVAGHTAPTRPSGGTATAAADAGVASPPGGALSLAPPRAQAAKPDITPAEAGRVLEVLPPLPQRAPRGTPRQRPKTTAAPALEP